MTTLFASSGCYLPLLFFLPQQCDTSTAAHTPPADDPPPALPYLEDNQPCEECGVAPATYASPGSYAYEALDLPGLGMAVRVAFHPTGTYALILEQANVVHIVGAASARFKVAPQKTLFWTDVAFAPSGAYALLTGRVDGKGVLYRFDHAQWQAGVRDAALLTPYVVPMTVDEPLWAVAFPLQGLPVILSGPETSPYWARLREFDPAPGTFSGLHAVQFTTAGCNHMAFLKDAWNQLGILITCGLGGGDYHYWRDGWQYRPGDEAPGNMAAIAAHPQGDRALVIDWSGRSVYHFADGTLGDYADAAHIAWNVPFGAAFQQSGERALIVGSVSGGRGTVLEYRDGYDRCPVLPGDCELSDVSVVGLPSLSAGTFYDVAYQPGCDGGLLVGGYIHVAGSNGYVLRFTRVGGAPCAG